MGTRVCSSRKNMHSVMNNGGKAKDLVIKRNGYEVYVPSQWLTKDGAVKKDAQAKIDNLFEVLYIVHDNREVS